MASSSHMAWCREEMPAESCLRVYQSYWSHSQDQRLSFYDQPVVPDQCLPPPRTPHASSLLEEQLCHWNDALIGDQFVSSGEFFVMKFVFHAGRLILRRKTRSLSSVISDDVTGRTSPANSRDGLVYPTGPILNPGNIHLPISRLHTIKSFFHLPMLHLSFHCKFAFTAWHAISLKRRIIYGDYCARY